jgi:hypothetical protein
MKNCLELYDGFIKLDQRANLLFRVTYGLQVTDNLTYSAACAALGQAILHHLCCEGLASNEGK